MVRTSLRVALASALALLAPGLPGAPAHAATAPGIRIVNGDVVITDAPGGALDVHVLQYLQFTSIQSNVPLEPLPAGCTRGRGSAARPHQLTCGGTDQAALDLGDGADRAEVVTTNGAPAVVGGLGDDVIGVTHLGGGRAIVFADRFGVPTWFDGHDVVTVGAATPSIVVGGAGRDTLRGGSGADHLLGGPSEDRIEGRGGPDTLDGEGGDDVVKGDDGADTVAGGPGADELRGGNGRDTLAARDGVTDRVVACGQGDGVADTVDADPSDPLQHCP